jgi:AcrR family transcriptional regulator
MNWTDDPDGAGRRGYHHGNLREALVNAALTLIAAKGPSGFSFAEAARAAGVSAAAPYRHFRDRDELVADVARRGFERLEAMLAGAWHDGKPEPVAAFEAVGKAYLAFARDEPAYYAAMFEAGVPLDRHPDLQGASDRAFAVLWQAADALVQRLPRDKRLPSLMMSLHVWALSHGVASLFARGDAARRRLPMSPEDLLEAGILVYLRGLGLGSDS